MSEPYRRCLYRIRFHWRWKTGRMVARNGLGHRYLNRYGWVSLEWLEAADIRPDQDAVRVPG